MRCPVGFSLRMLAFLFLYVITIGGCHRPSFPLLLRDRQTGLVLFMGKVVSL